MDRTRLALDISHAVHLSCNDDGRNQAIAFACATSGLKQALDLSQAEKAKLKAYHSSEGLGSYKLPGVVLTCRKSQGPFEGEEFAMQMVCPLQPCAPGRDPARSPCRPYAPCWAGCKSLLRTMHRIVRATARCMCAPQHAAPLLLACLMHPTEVYPLVCRGLTCAISAASWARACSAAMHACT
jgi:hypothetical protein